MSFQPGSSVLIKKKGNYQPCFSLLINNEGNFQPRSSVVTNNEVVRYTDAIAIQYTECPPRGRVVECRPYGLRIKSLH